MFKSSIVNTLRVHQRVHPEGTEGTMKVSEKDFNLNAKMSTSRWKRKGHETRMFSQMETMKAITSHLKHAFPSGSTNWVLQDPDKMLWDWRVGGSRQVGTRLSHDPVIHTNSIKGRCDGVHETQPTQLQCVQSRVGLHQVIVFMEMELLLLLRNERSQLRWFRRLARMLPGYLPGKVFQTSPVRKTPQGSPRTCWKHLTCLLGMPRCRLRGTGRGWWGDCLSFSVGIVAQREKL